MLGHSSDLRAIRIAVKPETRLIAGRKERASFARSVAVVMDLLAASVLHDVGMCIVFDAYDPYDFWLPVLTGTLRFV